uniref:Protein kinase domain-containing protein n=1 Tax=Ascaris lumbricoides TaxID=6252 RepID=A0A0M3IXF1_ASCLU
MLCRFKWLPPEVLHRREMSTKSDVWSYGITATEMYGVVDPYGMMSNEKVLPFLNGKTCNNSIKLFCRRGASML